MADHADAGAGPAGPTLDGRPRAIEAEGLVKAYGDTRALDGLDLVAEAGRILAVLGPNGAGKTTAVRVLTTLTVADAGVARVAGHDVRSEAAEVRRHIGLAGQDASLDEYLSGQANLVMIGRLAGLSKAEATRRGDELLERFELTGAAKRVVKTYSGGMRRRLDLAASLIGRPDVLFLDEPTTGLDPRSRIVMWDIIRDLAAEGATLLLTTQYLEEADHLADRIAVVDEGRVIAEGSAAELKRDVGGERLQVVVAPGHDLSAAGRIVEIYASGWVQLDPTSRKIDAPIPPNSHPIIHVLGLAVTAATGLAIGWRIHTGPVDALAALGLVLLLSYAVSWAGVCMGMVFRSAEAAQQAAFIIFLPLGFVSNAFVPTSGMPGWLQAFANWNPVSAAAASCRNLFGNPNPASSIDAWPMQHPEAYTVVWAIGVVAVFAPVAVYLYLRRARG